MTELLESQNGEALALPASAAQQRFWVLDRLKPGDPSLNVAVRFVLTGHLDRSALARALNEVIRRHEILRASFEMLDGQVVQVVKPALEIELPLTDLSALPEALRQTQLDQLADEAARAPFVLSEGPLLRAGLLRTNSTEHVLLITIHHIVSDGWSIGVITDEMGPIYEALVEGRESPLPELAIQYADFTVWQQENRNTAALAEAEQYWTGQLSGLPQFEVLPEISRSAGRPAIGNIFSRLLPLELTNSLRDLSRRENATLFMTMLAALATLLQRYTGETDVVVGSQVIGRNSVELEPLIGPFINTVILRVDASGDPVFPELLARVRQTVSDALAHQDLPLDRVAELLRVERSTDRNVLFQINFIYQRDFVHPWEYAGIRMRPIPSRSPGAMYDLNLFLVERAEGWRVSCEYNTGLYREPTIQALLQHFENLLNAILEDPGRQISDFRFLSAGEESRLVNGWNGTFTEYPRESCAHHLIEVQAAKTPTAVALVCRERATTYQELNAQSNQLARHLRGRGIEAGTLVGVALDRSTDMLVAVLAILKAGAGYVPLDPGFPKERLSFMAEDSRLRLSITPQWLNAERKSIAAQSTDNLDSGAGPDSTAYVIYTSGSTGKPKGVCIHHRALVNLLTAIVREPGVAERDALLAITTLSFDIAGLELLAPLIVGARILLATREQASDGKQLRQLLERSGVTILQATPATWRMLMESGWSGTPGLKMLCGGEPMSRELADSLLERGAELWNMYGPTETTIWSSWCRMQADGGPITIGRPAANQSFYILDGKGRPVPVGVPGELVIGGDGVAKGYHNRPEVTADRFVANPFAPGRMYRTGDRARFLPDGSVEMLGRMDTQVKIRGFRIELGEIEAALAACPAVRNGVVVVRQDASGQNALAGYFVPAREGSDVVEEVRRTLKQRLPNYMVPAFLIPLQALPQTPNGKLDRKALPAPEAVRGDAPRLSGAPQDALETTLIGIWESVLNVFPISRTDNFFEIGGHSVLAAKMFARMEKVLGQALPLATLFQGPTVERLAALLRDSGWTPPWSSLVPIRPGGTQPPFFFVHPIGGNVLNFAGFAGHFDPDQPVYGLQARGLDRKESPHTSIDEMANDYIREIRTVQASGPYYLGGFSAGGIVAFEMAKRLEAAGERVAVLALLDTKVSGGKETSERLIRTIRFNLRYAFQTGLSNFFSQKLKNWGMRIRIRLWMAGKQHPGMLGPEEAFLLALRSYRPEPYEGNAILFRAKDELVRYPDPNLGWGSLIRGQLQIREISGDHDTILYEPHIGMLARVLSSCLRSVQTAPEPGGSPQSFTVAAR